jgi:hypothetical protein
LNVNQGELAKQKTGFLFANGKIPFSFLSADATENSPSYSTKQTHQEDEKQDNLLRASKFELFPSVSLDYLIVSHIIKIDSYSINKVCVCLLATRFCCRNHLFL